MSSLTFADLKSANFSIFILLITLASVAAGILIGLEFYIPFTILILAILSICIFIEPLIGIYLILFVAFFLEGEFVADFVLFRLFGFNWYLMELSYFILIASIMIRLISGEYKLRFNSLIFFFILFFLTVFISVYIGFSNGNQPQSIFYDFRAFFYYTALIPTYFVLTKNNSNFSKILIYILIIGTIKSTLDIISSLFFLENTIDFETGRALSFSRLVGINEVVYPITLLLSLSIFVYVKSLSQRLLIAPSIIISFVALLMSYTRGSWLAFGITAIIVFIFLFKTKIIKINYDVVIFFILGFAALVSLGEIVGVFDFSAFIERFSSLSLSSVDVSNLGRLVEYATAIEAFSESPLLGKGLGFMFTYIAPGIGKLSTEYCHNSYLYVSAKMGILGLSTFILFFGYTIYIGFKELHNNRTNTYSFFLFVVSTLILFLALKSLTTWHLNTVTFSLFIGVLLGMLNTYKSYPKSESLK